MKRCYVLMGNYGSGKSEISLNFAFRAAGEGSCAFVDLDIINPYFRSSERKRELSAAGIRLIQPVFAGSTVDVPALPAEVYAAFAKGYDTVVFDVGGDPAGATAAGQYQANFLSLAQGALQTLLVVNARRPFSATPEMVEEMLFAIRSRSRLEITGLINNTNLSSETTAQDLFAGYEVVRRVSDATDIPVAYTAGTAEPLRAFLEQAKKEGVSDRYIGEPLELKLYMHRDWERFSRLGV